MSISINVWSHIIVNGCCRTEQLRFSSIYLHPDSPRIACHSVKKFLGFWCMNNHITLFWAQTPNPGLDRVFFRAWQIGHNRQFWSDRPWWQSHSSIALRIWQDRAVLFAKKRKLTQQTGNRKQPTQKYSSTGRGNESKRKWANCKQTVSLLGAANKTSRFEDEV